MSRLTPRMRAFHTLSPTLQGILWAAATGVFWAFLNTILRRLALQLDPIETQFLRYASGLVVMLPWILMTGLNASHGFKALWPKNPGGQVLRGTVHTMGLAMWFIALPFIPIADVTAIGFTTPIFVMIGAALVLREKTHRARWVAVVVAFIGVLIVVGPKLGGTGGLYNLLMLAVQPFFAASFLIAKVLTRKDSAQVIVVWQALVVATLTFPFALLHWTWPSPTQWMWFLIAGVLGTAGHYCMARALAATDISATQSVKFLDLVWTTALGLIVFGDPLSSSTLAGGTLIVAALVWASRYEARRGS